MSFHHVHVGLTLLLSFDRRTRRRAIRMPRKETRRKVVRRRRKAKRTRRTRRLKRRRRRRRKVSLYTYFWLHHFENTFCLHMIIHSCSRCSWTTYHLPFGYSCRLHSFLQETWRCWFLVCWRNWSWWWWRCLSYCCFWFGQVVSSWGNAGMLLIIIWIHDIDGIV